MLQQKQLTHPWLGPWYCPSTFTSRSLPHRHFMRPPTKQDSTVALIVFILSFCRTLENILNKLKALHWLIARSVANTWREIANTGPNIILWKPNASMRQNIRNVTPRILLVLDFLRNTSCTNVSRIINKRKVNNQQTKGQWLFWASSRHIRPTSTNLSVDRIITEKLRLQASPSYWSRRKRAQHQRVRLCQPIQTKT